MTRPKNVLVACEFSGTVGSAFGSRGHRVVTADLLPSESPNVGRLFTHHTGDARDVLADPVRWFGAPVDILVAHPPCTYLTNAGARWLYHKDGSKNVDRWRAMADGAALFRDFLRSGVPHIAVENPVMVGHAKILLGVDGEPAEPSQVVQPWMFGHLEVKATCLWLKGLPPLEATDNVRDRMLRETTYAQRAKVHHASPGPNRWKVRSLTYPGLAEAMAAQWGDL